MTSHASDEQLAIVNSLVLDAGALQGRIEAAVEFLASCEGQDGQMRAKAVKSFRDAILEATTRLRQDGLHPDGQGTLW